MANSSGVQDDIVTAWYSKELAVSLGPYVFQGLPGLILEVSSNNNLLLYRAQKIKLNSEKAIKIKISKRSVISEEEANTITKKNFYSYSKS